VLEQAKAAAAPENKPSAFLVTSLTVVAAVFTGLGFTGGLIGRVARNHPTATGVALVVAALAVAIGVAAHLVPARHARVQAYGLGLGLLLFIVAICAAVVAGVRTWGDETAPRVSAAFEKTARGGSIAISVKGSGV
jgi:hypothetical protein